MHKVFKNKAQRCSTPLTNILWNYWLGFFFKHSFVVFCPLFLSISPLLTAAGPASFWFSLCLNPKVSDKVGNIIIFFLNVDQYFCCEFHIYLPGCCHTYLSILKMCNHEAKFYVGREGISQALWSLQKQINKKTKTKPRWRWERIWWKGRPLLSTEQCHVALYNLSISDKHLSLLKLHELFQLFFTRIVHVGSVSL